MNTFQAHVTFDGNCAEAMHFYEQTLGGKLEKLMTYGESPFGEHTPAESIGKILHASLKLPNGMLMGCDRTAEHPYEGVKGISLALVYPTAAEARRAYEALAEGGRITMALDKTFWAEAFGMVTDRFGTPWIINGAMSA